MSKIEDIDLVNYVINKKATLKEAATYFGVSVSTIKKKMSAIKSSLDQESDVYISLNNISSSNQTKGRIDGGKAHAGLKYGTYSIDEILAIAMDMISYNLSIDDAAAKYNIPPSTLYDRLNCLNCDEYKELYQDLIYMFEIHRKGNDGDKERELYINKLMMKYQMKLDEKSNTKK